MDSGLARAQAEVEQQVRSQSYQLKTKNVSGAETGGAEAVEGGAEAARGGQGWIGGGGRG